MNTQVELARAMKNAKSLNGMKCIQYDGKTIAIIGDHVGIDVGRESITSLGEALVNLGSASGFATAALAGFERAIKKLDRYGPCQGCGKPAKLGYCFKCQQKDGVA